jgi:PTH1 family peptidyl-tRNA hydrolase
VKVIVGLGNPGERYEGTRHNVGFMALDRLAERWDIKLAPSKMKGWLGEGVIHRQKVILLKPATYMNLSGESVRAALDWYKADRENLVVVYDDLDLPTGQLRLREKGGAGGHNGIKSIIQHLGTPEFKRVRIGIDRPAPGSDIAHYVLDHFPKSEHPTVLEALDRSCDAIEYWLQENFFKAMNQYPK